MNKLILVVLLSILASTLADRASLEKWKQFKSRHGKFYKTEHEQVRFKKFMQVDKIIDEHNKLHDEGKVTFKMAHNQFSDMTEEEIKEFRGIPNEHAEKDRRSVSAQKFTSYTKRVAHNVFTRNASVPLPASVNWVNSGWNTPVKNQGSCGSCWAFSTIGAVEAALKLKKGISVDLSEQKLVDCTYAKERATQGITYGGCKGGWPYDAMDFIMQQGGDVEEASYKYITAEGQCKSPTTTKYTIKDYYKVQAKDENALKEAVATIGPVSVCLDVSPDTFMNYRSGIWDGRASNGAQCSNSVPNHAVLLVGYGSENGVNYWLIKNSWGPNWGEKGYVKVKATGGNLCAITNEAAVPVV